VIEKSQTQQRKSAPTAVFRMNDLKELKKTQFRQAA
jgi:hypothetical protein